MGLFPDYVYVDAVARLESNRAIQLSIWQYTFKEIRFQTHDKPCVLNSPCYDRLQTRY